MTDSSSKSAAARTSIAPSKLETLRGALDEAQAAVAGSDLHDYTASLLEEIDDERPRSDAQGSGM